MEIIPKKNIIIIDPYLLIHTENQDKLGLFKNCRDAKFLVCEHMDKSYFTSDEFDRMMHVIKSDEIDSVPVAALHMAELMTICNHLVPYQISIIAAAKFYECHFASDCCIFQKQASSVIGEERVFSGSEIRRLTKTC